MKKGVAILLTAIMLLTGIQPVLALHLCAGSLFSVTLFDEAEGVSCCNMNSCSEMPMQDANHGANDKGTHSHSQTCCEMPMQGAHDVADDKDTSSSASCEMPMQAVPGISAGQKHSAKEQNHSSSDRRHPATEQRHSTTEKKQSARDQRHSTTDQRHSATVQKHSATNASSEINLIHKNYCDVQVIEISTDEFTRDAEQQTTQNLTQLSHVWTVIIALLQKITPDNTLTLTQLFPPAGLSRLTTDLLTFICIYRI